MQAKSESFSEYSERTEILSRKLHINVSDLPERIGVSASMFHAYRSGKYPISPKAWRKLEKAERAAGISALVETVASGNAGSYADPKGFPVSAGEKLPGQEDPFSMQSLMDAILLHQASFTLAELEARMSAAHAWPASPSDRHLTPAQLWQKYAPA